ncbi:Uncharacterised protein [Plesiomonas shigelloides]|nr:Uncharacterised protein [Plesiomonas shigelloides]
MRISHSLSTLNFFRQFLLTNIYYTTLLPKSL